MNFKSLHLDKICPSGKKVSATRMDSKNLKFTRNALCALLATIPLCELQAQPPADPPADPPAAPQAANELEQLFVDAEKAFTEKNYPVAVGKLEELLKQIDGKQGVPPATLEMIRFNMPPAR
jgi:hypothetical protein